MYKLRVHNARVICGNEYYTGTPVQVHTLIGRGNNEKKKGKEKGQFEFMEFYGLRLRSIEIMRRLQFSSPSSVAILVVGISSKFLVKEIISCFTIL